MAIFIPLSFGSMWRGGCARTGPALVPRLRGRCRRLRRTGRGRLRPRARGSTRGSGHRAPPPPAVTRRSSASRSASLTSGQKHSAMKLEVPVSTLPTVGTAARCGNGDLPTKCAPSREGRGRAGRARRSRACGRSRASVASTVFRETNTWAAISGFVRPSAASCATRSSLGVRPSGARREATRCRSASARATHASAPRLANTFAASSSAVRASRLRFRRRSTCPWTSSVRRPFVGHRARCVLDERAVERRPPLRRARRVPRAADRGRVPRRPGSTGCRCGWPALRVGRRVAPPARASPRQTAASIASPSTRQTAGSRKSTRSKTSTARARW